ncbi:nitrate reductase [Pluralibacter gergoviae]|uniref:chaperone NapD n=1 Tax=Pluralibacter gergoviae TaxID=61647 RepID=UPI00065049B9|nr:chaperone NapD [Pluralibacter gergoviae]KMK17063.1 nitrate reductase [Pluralibacter gergoviae]
MEDLWQVCSLVVRIKKQQISAVSEAIARLAGCDVSLSDADAGTLIVVIEGESSSRLLETIESVRNISGVLAVSLAYHQQEQPGEDAP